MQRTVCVALVLVLVTGCEYTARVRVRDPWRVMASVDDLDAGAVRLSGDVTRIDARVDEPIGRPGRGNRGPSGPQRVTLRREGDGAIAIDAPDTWGHTHDTLVDGQGSVLATAPSPNAGAVGWDGDVLRMRLAYTYASSSYARPDGGRPTVPSFEVQMTTARSNVVEIESRREPIRFFGWMFLGIGALMAAGSISCLSSRDPTVRLGGGVWLGVPALSFLVGSGVFLFMPERIERERFAPPVADLPGPRIAPSSSR